MYNLKYGDTKWLYDQWVSKGSDENNKPPQIQNRPTLRQPLVFYYSSFWELSTERLLDGGYIPWSAINRYANRWGIVCDAEFDSFLHIIRSCDRAYVEYLQKEREKEMKK